MLRSTSSAYGTPSQPMPPPMSRATATAHRPGQGRASFRIGRHVYWRRSALAHIHPPSHSIAHSTQRAGVLRGGHAPPHVHRCAPLKRSAVGAASRGGLKGRVHIRPRCEDSHAKKLVIAPVEAHPVPVQMWHGRARLRCRCGKGEPSPGADAAWRIAAQMAARDGAMVPDSESEGGADGREGGRKRARISSSGTVVGREANQLAEGRHRLCKHAVLCCAATCCTCQRRPVRTRCV